MDIDVLRDLLREGDGRHQEFADPAFPDGAPMHHVVAGIQGQPGHGAQRQHQQYGFPRCQMVGDKDLPEREHERDRIERHPCPDGQLVQEQPACGRLPRVQVPLFRTEDGVEVVREPEKKERTREPPAAVSRGHDHEWKNREGHEVRDGVPDRRPDERFSSGRSNAQTAWLYATLSHGNLRSPRDHTRCRTYCLPRQGFVKWLVGSQKGRSGWRDTKAAQSSAASMPLRSAPFVDGTPIYSPARNKPLT